VAAAEQHRLAEVEVLAQARLVARGHALEHPEHERLARRGGSAVDGAADLVLHGLGAGGGGRRRAPRREEHAGEHEAAGGALPPETPIPHDAGGSAATAGGSAAAPCGDSPRP
jgi:hypothetical protein